MATIFAIASSKIVWLGENSTSATQWSDKFLSVIFPAKAQQAPTFERLLNTYTIDLGDTRVSLGFRIGLLKQEMVECWPRLCHLAQYVLSLLARKLYLLLGLLQHTCVEAQLHSLTSHFLDAMTASEQRPDFLKISRSRDFVTCVS